MITRTMGMSSGLEGSVEASIYYDDLTNPYSHDSKNGSGINLYFTINGKLWSAVKATRAYFTAYMPSLDVEQVWTVIGQ